MYKLTNDSQGELNSLIAISSSILEIYKELSNLEIENKKASIDYKRALEKLKCSINLEDSLFSNIATDEQNIIRIKEELEQKILLGQTNAIIQDNTLELIRHRLLSKIGLFILNSHTTVIKLSMPKLKEEDFALVENEDYINSIANKIIGYSRCRKQLCEEVYLLSIILLEKSINNPYKKDIKRELIKSKYYKIFMGAYIEKDLLEKSYNIPENICIINPMTSATFYNAPIEELEKMYQREKNRLYEIELNSLMAYNNSFISPLELTLREIQIRVALQYFTDEEINIMNERFHNIEEISEVNEEIISTIESAYKLRKYDKRLIISLKI